MNNDPWEAPLRAAKPTNDEIAPLSPEASSRILSAALRANRRSRRTPFWLAAPFRVAIGSVATAAFAYCLMPRIDFAEVPVAESTVVATASPAAKDERAVTQPALPAAKSLPKPSALPTLPSVLPKPVAPSVMLAKTTRRRPHPPTPLSLRRERRERTNPGITLAGMLDAPGLPPLPSEGEGGGGVRATAGDEGNMYVSVTGDSVLPPESDTEDGLTVTVHHDVPDTVVGSAEAAALHAVPVPSVTPDPANAQAIPVWTHVRIETGEEPVLTLTALN